MATEEEVELTEQQLRLAEELGLTKEEYLKIIKEINDEEDLSISRMEKRLQAAEKELELAKNIGDQQEAALNLEVERMRLAVLRGEASEEELRSLEELNKNISQTAAKYDQVFDRFFGVSDRFEGTAFGMLFQPGGMQGLFNAMQRTFTISNMIGSSLLKVAEETKKLALATDSTLVEFNRATGAVGTYGDMMMEVEGEMFRYGAGLEEVGAAATALTTKFTSFRDVSKSAQTDLMKTTALLDKMGVSSDITAGNVQIMTSVMGLSAEAAAATSREMFTFAQAIGMPPAEMAGAFQEAAPHMSKFGSMGTEVFKDVAAAAREAGMEVGQLLSITEKFDTFEGAAETVGKLNAVLGGPFLNSLELVSATNPVDRMRMLSDAANEAGKSFDDMAYYEKITLANAMGLKDVGELALVMAGQFDTLGDTMQNMSQTELIDLQKQTTDFNTLQDELNQLYREFALQLQPVVALLKSLLQGFQAVNEYFGGSLPVIITIVGALFLLAKVLTSGTLAFQLFLPALGLIGPTAAPASSGIITLVGPTAALGAAMNTAAPGILAFGFAILSVGASVFLAAIGISMIVDSLSELFKVASPEQMLAFGASLLFIASAMNMLALASVFLLPITLLLGVVTGAFIGLAAALSMMNFENLRPIADLFQAIATIMTGEVENLTNVLQAVKDTTDSIQSIDDTRKITAVQNLVATINGNAAMVPAAGTTAATSVAPGGQKQDIYINFGRGLEVMVGSIVKGMFIPAG